VRRREFITLIGGAVTGWPIAARAQQSTMPVIGFLHAGSADGYARELVAVRQGLSETGYIEGQSVAIEYRWADGHYEQLPDLLADLLRHNAAVVVAATLASVAAAKQASATIPIVFELGVDPVRLGLVASLNRPGGNFTGIVNLSNTLVPKRVELIHQVLPNAVSIAVLLNPNGQNFKTQMDDLLAAQKSLGVQIEFLHARTASEIEAAFPKVVEQRAGSLVIGADAFLTSKHDELAALAARYGVPTIHESRAFVTAGGLMSYGADLTDAYHLAGIYAGRVLKGEKPADLPVQQSTKIELVINLKAAKALGLAFPLPLLGRADEVIE